MPSNKITTEEFIQRCRDRYGSAMDNISFDKFEYKGNNTKATFTCKYHGDFITTPNSFYSQMGGCPVCNKEKTVANRKMTTEEFITKCKEKWGSVLPHISYEKVNYTKSSEKVTLTCKHHGDFQMQAGSFLSHGYNCPTCANESQRTTSTSSKNKVLNELKNRWGDKFYFDLTNYETKRSKIDIYCYKHGWFKTTPARLLHKENKFGCKDCAYEKRNHYMKKSFDQYVKEIRSLYDIPHITMYGDTFVDSTTEMKFFCEYHGEFYTTPSSFKHQMGDCPDCNKERANQKRRLTTEQYLDKLLSARPEISDKYDLSKVDYQGAKNKIIIGCASHGDVEVYPYDLLYGGNCPKCAPNYPLTHDDFIERVREKFGEVKFLPDNFQYQNIDTKSQFYCDIHGWFESSPYLLLLNKEGCPYCGRESTESIYERVLVKHPERADNPCTLYVLRISNDEERFIKIGITTMPTKQRFWGAFDSYKYEIIEEFHSTLEKCLNIEKQTLTHFRKHLYQPKELFGGHTECLKLFKKNEVLDLINDKFQQ